MRKLTPLALVLFVAACGSTSDEVPFDTDHPQYEQNVQDVRDHLIADYGITETAQMCDGLNSDARKDILLQLLQDSEAEYSGYGDSLDLAYQATIEAAEDICSNV